MTHQQRSFLSGMTLVEIMIALAIASIMTLTGWRAVDALQTSRDRIVAEAAQWQRLDDFFVTLEADLRRASFNEFSGNGSGLVLLQPALDGGPEVRTIGYRFASLGGTAEHDGATIAVLRESGSERTPMAELKAMTVSYSMDGTAFVASIDQFPRAIRITAVTIGNGSTIERLLALR